MWKAKSITTDWCLPYHPLVLLCCFFGAVLLRFIRGTGMNLSTTPIRSLRKTSPDGHDILLAVNVDQGRSIATFALPGLLVGTMVEVLFEGRSVEVMAGGSFSDGFEGLGAHVYQL